MVALQIWGAHLSRQVNGVVVMSFAYCEAAGRKRDMVVTFAGAMVVDGTMGVTMSMRVGDPSKPTKMDVGTCIVVA